MTWILKKLNEITYVQEGFLINKNDSQLNGNFKRFMIRLTIDNHSRCYCKVLLPSRLPSCLPRFRPEKRYNYQ